MYGHFPNALTSVSLSQHLKSNLCTFPNALTSVDIFTTT